LRVVAGASELLRERARLLLQCAVRGLALERTQPRVERLTFAPERLEHLGERDERDALRLRRRRLRETRLEHAHEQAFLAARLERTAEARSFQRAARRGRDRRLA